MTDCAETRQNLHLFVGGELEPSQASSAKRHLSLCAPCRTALGETTRARELYLRAAVDADAEELDLWPGIRSRLVSEGRLVGATLRDSGQGARAASDRRSAANREAQSSSGARIVQVSSSRVGRRLVWAGLAAAAAALWLFALPFLRAEPRFVPVTTPIATPEQPLPGFSFEPVSADAVAGNGTLLRPVLQGEESLRERAWREHVEGKGDPGTPFDDAYEVVNGRRLR